MKAFLFRHQHGGFDATRVFLREPTDDQMAAMNARADELYGSGWAIASPIEVIEDDAVPTFDTGEPGAASEPGSASIGAPLYSMGAVGHVEEITTEK